MYEKKSLATFGEQNDMRRKGHGHVIQSIRPGPHTVDLIQITSTVNALYLITMLYFSIVFHVLK